MYRRVFPAGSRARLLAALALSCAALRAQSLMPAAGPGGVVRIFNTDSAVLESQDPRKDLPCIVTPVKAWLGFDLRFHAGYEISVPLREIAGTEDLLTMVFRVTPENHKDGPVYLSQRISVPAIDRDAKGDAYLRGGFDLGEGNYHVDWLMRDRSERVCSSYWEIDASLPARDKQLAMVMSAGEVRASEREAFKEEPPVSRETREGALNVKVLVNFAPQNARSATLQPRDTTALISILRSIAREPKIAKFSVVAFNMQEQRIIHRQDNSDQIDFPSLGDALESLKLGTVDLNRLGQKHGDTQFLSRLIAEECNTADPPDALIFAGPKVLLEEGIPAETLRQVGDLSYPVFYMNYNAFPQAVPWRDAIGVAVKHFKGFEYTISRPRDLWFAWSDIISRIVKLRHGRPAVSVSSQ